MLASLAMRTSVGFWGNSVCPANKQRHLGAVITLENKPTVAADFFKKLRRLRDSTVPAFALFNQAFGFFLTQHHHLCSAVEVGDATAARESTMARIERAKI